MFKLTEEQIMIIISEYGGNEQLIESIELILNRIEMIDDFDDYYELVCLIAAQYETALLKFNRERKSDENAKLEFNIYEVIKSEILLKYSNSINRKSI